jgi:TolB protein
MDPYNLENEDSQEIVIRQWPTKLLASCLLVVMLCMVTATPLAVAYRFFEQQRIRQEVKIEAAIPSVGVNRVAYVGPDQQLYTVAPDGSDLRRLTDDDRIFQFPAWSPDGTQIGIVGEDTLFTFPDRDGAQTDDQYEILYQDETDRPFYLYWAPDGEEVGFLTNHADGLALHLASALSTLESQQLAVGQPFYWNWDAAGDELLVHTVMSGGAPLLAFLDLESGGFGENLADPGLFQTPGISSDGQYWAYAQRGSAGLNHVTIQESNGRSNLIDQQTGSVAMNWGPAEPSLAYISAGEHGHAFYGPLQLVSAATGEHQVLVDDTIIAFFWSPDGRFIAYFKFSGPIEDSVQVRSDRLRKDSLSKTTSQQRALRLELWVIDLATGDSRWLIEFEPSRPFLSQFLPYFDQYALSHRLWSPNSDALLIPLMDSDGSHLYLIPINGEEPIPIADAEIGFWSWQ